MTNEIFDHGDPETTDAGPVVDVVDLPEFDYATGGDPLGEPPKTP